MDTLIYFLLALAYIILFVMGWMLIRRYKWRSLGHVLLIVTAALLYDNGILALGSYIGEGDLLRNLNQARYWLHALCTPLLIVFAWGTLRNANLAWAKKALTLWLTLILTIGSIFTELATEVWGIVLKPVSEHGVLSYDKVHHAGIPPAMIIIVTIVLLVTSLIIWWKQRWPVYFLGVLAIGAAPLIQLIIKTDAAHNITELLLMIALYATNSYQLKKQ